MSLIGEAISNYNLLIDELAKDSNRNFGAIGDPEFEGVRFYTFQLLSGSFNYNEATELGEVVVDDIEDYLLRIDSEYALFKPMLDKLRSIAPAFNANGKTVFLGAWGTGPGEIGWYIRYINDRARFDAYLDSAGIDEKLVDAYNESIQEALKQ